MPGRLVVLGALLAGCATPPLGPPAGDRRAGPANLEPCPGARWTGSATSYDLAAAPLILEAGVLAEPGERVVAVSHRTGFSEAPVEAGLEASVDGAAWAAVRGEGLTCWSSDTGTNGELGASARDCVGVKQVRLGYVVGAGARRFRLVLRAVGPGKATGRARVQVVPAACRALDACWGASGNNCDGAPLSNCTEAASGLLRCPTSVGSQAHDSCCSRWGPGAYVCGHCGSALNDRADLAGCLIADPPQGLEGRLVSRPAQGFPGGYIPCRAEWDLAFRDVAALPRRLWSFDFDPLEITWRPTEVTRLTVVRGKPVPVPLPGALLLPAGAHLRTLEAEQGWCASGRWAEAAAGVARCE